MGEFRIGRKTAQHSYPESRRGAMSLARNYATGPEEITGISNAGAGTALPWSAIASGAAPGVNVPITPRSSGILRISAVIAVINNAGEGEVTATVSVSINGVLQVIPVTTTTIGVGDSHTIPVLVENTVALPVGVVANVQIFVLCNAAAAMSYSTEESSIDVQEVPVATG